MSQLPDNIMSEEDHIIVQDADGNVATAPSADAPMEIVEIGSTPASDEATNDPSLPSPSIDGGGDLRASRSMGVFNQSAAPSPPPTGALHQSTSASDMASTSTAPKPRLQDRLAREVLKLHSDFGPGMPDEVRGVRQCRTERAMKVKEKAADEKRRAAEQKKQRVREAQGLRQKRPVGYTPSQNDKYKARHDETGSIILNADPKQRFDLCDCLRVECKGCFFPCALCGGEKCSFKCQRNRIEVVDYITMGKTKQMNPILHPQSAPTVLADSSTEGSEEDDHPMAVA